MKIGYVLRSLEDSGVTVYVLNLAEAMRRRGHDVFLVSDGGVYQDEVIRRGFRHHLLPLCRGPLASYLAARRLAGIVAPEQPDILHGNWRRANLACHLAEKKLGLPFVTTLHLVGIPSGWLYRRLSHWGSAVIAPCSEAAAFLRDTFGVAESRIRLIFHGVDPDLWPPTTAESRAAARRQLALPSDAPTAVCVARLEAIKGHCTLLAAAAQVVKVRPDFHLLLVGRGQETEALQRLTAELGLSQTVRFLGWCDPRPALAAADVFVLASRHESFGFAPVEAMLTGLPVIRTATEGACDQIRAGQTGEIVPIGDTAALARALTDVAAHGDSWRRRGQMAREDAAARFTLSAMAEKVEAVYQEVIAEAGRGASSRGGR